MIVVPGLIDAHRHCWQNQFRRLIADADLNEYVATTHGGMALHYRPEDTYAGNLVSCLGMLETGVTCVLDFSHNSRSGAHSDVPSGRMRLRGSGPSTRRLHRMPANGSANGHDLVRLHAEFCSPHGVTTSVRMGIDQWTMSCRSRSCSPSRATAGSG